MTASELLKGRSHCECGRDHVCPIKFLRIGSGAISALAETAGNYGRILLVADENTYSAAGEAVCRILGEKICDKIIFGKDILVPDEAAIAAIEERIQGVQLVLGIGSGVINDLCKYTSHKAGIRYQIVATAPSMDGYASVGAALILGGMKVTLNAAVPEAIICDTEVLRQAPMDMIIAGYGDIMGKYSCLNDWRLAALVRGEYICDFVWQATMDTVVETRRVAGGLKERDGEAVAALMRALVGVGILMAYVGNSRPASGSEHHFSHFFEITGIVDSTPYLPHGTDVFYSARETAKIREELLNTSEIRNTPPHFDEKSHESEIRRIYGKVADEVLALQKKTGFYAERERRYAIYVEKWDGIRELLATAPTVSEMDEMLEEVGMSAGEFKSFYGEEKLKDAYLYAKDLKDRYTVLWLYTDVLGY